VYTAQPGVDLIRRRACCSDPRCSAPSWTVYEFGGYPGRGFSLPVVNAAVCEVSLGGKARSAVARVFGCSRRSVARWCAWIARLTEAKKLAQACARLHPDGLPFRTLESVEGAVNPAAVVLSLLEQWALIVTWRGVRLPGKDSEPGWIRVLSDQLERFGVVLRLTQSSPPLRIDPPPD